MIYSTAKDGHKRRRIRPWQILQDSTTGDDIVPTPPDFFKGNASYWRQFHVHQYESSSLVDFVFERCRDDLVVDTRGFHKVRKDAKINAQCVWTADERDRLYNGLSRFSINQVDLIKDELLPEKSELEILQFYYLMKKELAVCQSNEDTSKSLVSLKDFPISYEMSETYVALEEREAAFLQVLDTENGNEHVDRSGRYEEGQSVNGMLKQNSGKEISQVHDRQLPKERNENGENVEDKEGSKHNDPVQPNELDPTEATQVSSDEEFDNTPISLSSESSSSDSANEDYEDYHSLAEEETEDMHSTELVRFEPEQQTTGSLQVTQLLVDVAKKYLRDLIFVIIKNQLQAHSLTRNNIELSFFKMSSPEVITAILEISPYWHLSNFRDERKKQRNSRKRKLEMNTESNNLDIPWSFANDEEIRGTVFQDLESTKRGVVAGDLVRQTFGSRYNDSNTNSLAARIMMAEKEHLVKLNRVPPEYKIPRKDSFIKGEQFCMIDSDLVESFFIRETDQLEELDARNSRIFEHNVLSDFFKAMKKSPITTRTLRFTLTSRLEIKYRQLKNERDRLVDKYISNAHSISEAETLRGKMTINSISDELINIKQELAPEEALDPLTNPELGKFKTNATYGFEELDSDELYKEFTLDFAKYDSEDVEY
ncbi:BA75_03708T0 [Komagataella pastoris]|uniref:BA75_03708T0 n=1 Tax=Komagataella pastoris TaxID=4922 RepID=A0A1B2JG12_PICPA|nr:BA75_03708T0 [Komagataella pastoris]